MTDASDAIPTVEIYRGVGIHDRQPRERIDHVVKPAIDAVYLLTDPPALATYAGDVSKPPEARLFAAARAEASFELAAERREVRPKVDLTQLRASIAGVDSLHWRDPWHYGSLLDAHARTGRVRREHKIPGRST